MSGKVPLPQNRYIETGESPGLAEADPFFNIADSGTGPELTSSQDANISAHDLEEPLHLSEEDELEEECKFRKTLPPGNPQYTPEMTEEEIDSEMVPADECDLPMRRHARVTDLSQGEMTETGAAFEPLNFNYSAVES